VRQGQISINENIVSAIFSVADIMTKMVESIKKNEKMEVDVEGIIKQLNDSTLNEETDEVQQEQEENGSDALSGSLEQKTVPSTDEEEENTAPVADAEEQKIMADGSVSGSNKKNDTPVSANNNGVAIKKDEVASQTLRVDLDKLDNLMNLAGEIVIARAQLLKIASNIGSRIKDEEDKMLVGNLNATAERISRISVDIQMEVMQTRLVPIGGLFRRFGRVVRDVANLKRKKIDLKVLGEDTELDKKIVDELGDPLTHLVRNAADHGIESPKERVSKGKPAMGTVQLNAYHEASNVCIEISDDGKGMDINSIKEKAVFKGLVTPSEIEHMSDKEIINFVFAPGFSTAETVTETSGRGVGLDVVKDKIEQLNGSVSIHTEYGKGSRFVLRLPLTLAIVSSILTKIGEDVYALPLDSVSEIIRVDSGKAHMIGSQISITHRNKVLPIVYLHETWNVIVVSNQDYKLGIVVDTLIGREDITIKSLGKNSKQISGVMGASILGDGNVCLILDVAGLFKMAMRRDREQVKNKMEGAV
jgi:two-component system chemotaxis sensor kinase CheA